MTFPLDLLTGISQFVEPSPIDNRDLLSFTNNNTIQTSRYINQQTQDFEVSGTNHLLGQNAVDQEVLLALNTTFGSSSEAGFGQNFSSIKLINGQTIDNQVQGIVTGALSTLITNSQITINNISVSTLGSQVNVGIIYVNNTTNTVVPLTFTTGT